MSVTIEYIREPHLEFGGHFLHPDKKTGLAETGPFGCTDPALHPTQIRVGIVGTRATAELCERWVDECRHYIETTKTQRRTMPAGSPSLPEEVDEDVIVEALVKSLTPDFVGMSAESSFATSILTAERWRATFQDREARLIADGDNPIQRVERATDLIAEHIERIATVSPAPDVILVAMPEVLLENSSTAQLGNGGWLNLRRGLKARSMKWGVPIQILREDTLSGKKPSLQDRATRAWNFATALYFKGGGVPWRGHGLGTDTCYVGVTFYKAEDAQGRIVMRTGVAQAFDYLGQGVVLRGDPFEWDVDEHGKTPHLTQAGAADLMRKVLTEYEKISRLPPKRVVVHKSSRFWGAEHREFNELAGFFEGISAVNARAEIDLVTLDRSRVRLARIGRYPPVRGTFAMVDDAYPILYTHGFTPYFDTYPGVHVPEPWTILEKHGDSGPRELAAEILALTKMNVNNAAFSDGVPITMAFSRKVSEILKQVSPEMTVRSEYKFYM
ncbi:hypothetical protein GOFOIKOB_0321 [Methylobacterium tardum]|jgi:hypothetical protein|uniref:Piwi domain-containing protein n=1 Tax=Methylobacterium tardum TaxID=374432 RepID=A0AA37TNE2_9HYPH|nr:hypothetical protein [Methylobacterium tardum]GJE47300.1 hypothetical protein GOFOIKOB_0321 [Methylobacterium tardum]GLS71328.1 hypothetical protein GCM10007890_33410 [Methylobacterium tardum]